MTILQQFVWFVWLCSNVQTVKWVKYMQTAGYNGTHMVYKFHQQEHCVGCFKDPEIDDLQGEIPGKTFLVMIWSQLSHNSPTSRICVKYFLSFPQKNQRKLNQTKCSLFNFRMIELTNSPIVPNYRISLYSFRRNYSFSDLEIQRSQYIRPKVTVHKCAETIQGRKLFKGGNYMRKYGIY